MPYVEKDSWIHCFSRRDGENSYTYTVRIQLQVSVLHILTSLSSPADAKRLPFGQNVISLTVSGWEGPPVSANIETGQSPLGWHGKMMIIIIIEKK